jgi:hypothetical protein
MKTCPNCGSEHVPAATRCLCGGTLPAMALMREDPALAARTRRWLIGMSLLVLGVVSVLESYRL